MKNPSSGTCGAKHRTKLAVWEVDKREGAKISPCLSFT